MKNIWIINQYATTPTVSGNGHRHYYLSKEFEKKDYKTTIITSAFNHFKKEKKKIHGLYKIIKSDIDVVLLASNSYKTTEGYGRVISMFIFLIILFIFPKKKLPKPDIIIISSISLLPIIYGFWYKIMNPKCKFILEIRDIWPLTLIEVGNYSYKNVFIRFLSWVEKLGYKNADYITSLLKNTDIHIKSTVNGLSFNYEWISNGYFLEDNKSREPLNIKVKDKLPENHFLVGYAGSLGNANAMDYVIKAFNKIEHEDIILCIVGSGDKKNDLMRMSTKNNVLFFDSIPNNQVQSFLEEMDLLYLSWKNIPLYRFGVSANKIFDYMYSGKPVLMSGNMDNDPISLSKGGKVVSPEDVNAIIEGLMEFYNLSELDRQLKGDCAKKYLLNNFTYKILANKYLDVFEAVA